MSTSYPIRRRPRICKTCLPCRASKVRCDRNVPCGNCAKRNFTCSYSSAPLSGPSSLQPQQSQQSQQSHRAGYSATTTTLTPSSIPSVRITPDTSQFAYATNGRGDDGGGAGFYRGGIGFPARREEDEDEDDGYDEEDDDDSSSENVTISQAEWDEIHTKMGAMEQILASLHSLFQAHSGTGAGTGAGSSRRKGPDPPPQPPPPPAAAPEDTSNEERPSSQSRSNPFKPGRIHIGSRSALVDILDRSRRPDDTARALPKDDLLAELALGNQSVAYPFVDLWSSDPFTFSIAAVCDVLPDDVQCHG